MSDLTASSKNSTSIMVRLSIMMFLQFWIWGSWFVSIPTYVGGLEHMGDSIFYCYGAIPIAAMIAPFFLGLIADRFFNTEKVLGVLFLLAGGALLMLPKIGELTGSFVQTAAAVGTEGAKDFVAAKGYLEVEFLGSVWNKSTLFNWFILFHALCYMPTLALTASLSFKHLADGSKQFPLVRLWGTFGWIFGAIALMAFNSTDAAGKTIGGEASSNQFLLAGGAAVLLGLFCFTLPKTPAPKKGEPIDLGALFFVDVWKEFKNPSFFVFVFCSFLLCIPLQAYYAYLQNQMKLQGFINYASWKNAGTWLEAFMMFLMPFFFRRLGVKKMLLVGIGAWVVRYALFPLAASQGIMANGISFTHPAFLLIIGGVLLHGICYDFFFVTGQIYVDQSTDIKIRGQAQSMLIFFTQGVGMYIGAEFVNNKLFMNAFQAKDMGTAFKNAANPEMLTHWSGFWWPLCGAAAAIFVIFLLFFKHKDKEGAEFTH